MTAFKIYLPAAPRQDVNHGELPWVYDQDPASGNVASMWVTPVKNLSPKRPLTDEQIVEIYTNWESKKGTSWADLMKAVEAAHGIKENT